MDHNAQAIVITCIDFRFQEYIQEFLETNFQPKTFDRVAWAGGIKNLDQVLGQIDIAVKLHQIKKVILVNHEDCGAYGAQGTIEKHTQDLKAAKEKVLETYPDLEVETYYLLLDGTFEPIS